jgi:hypothetical protein
MEMVDDKKKDQNQQSNQSNKKAMGASAGAQSPGKQGSAGQPNLNRNRQETETAGQGGGIQGTGQRQSNPGGYTSDQGGNVRDDQSSSQGRQGGPER